MRALELSGLAIGQGWVSGKLSNCPGPVFLILWSLLLPEFKASALLSQGLDVQFWRREWVNGNASMPRASSPNVRCAPNAHNIHHLFPHRTPPPPFPHRTNVPRDAQGEIKFSWPKKLWKI